MKPKRIRPPHDAPPAKHMRRKSSIVVNGARIDMPMCLANGWTLVDSWNEVTCKRCLRRRCDDRRASHHERGIDIQP